MNTKELYDWYYCPGEVMLGIGFYKNPYRQWASAKFRHIFAFDAVCNLYVGQYSVYSDHMNKVCDLDDQREFGIVYPANSNIPPDGVDKLNGAELCIDEDDDANTYASPELQKRFPIVEFKFLESKNIMYLNKRLKKIAQRLFDYGMPKDTILFSSEIDLWNIRIYQILKNEIVERRPSIEKLQANL